MESDDNPFSSVQQVIKIIGNLNDLKQVRNIAAPAEIRLKRFLHYGNEEAVYTPEQKELTPECLHSIDALIEKEKANEIVNHIVKAHMDGYVTQRCNLIFVLATCAQQTKNAQLKRDALAAVGKICITSQDLFLFLRYFKNLGNKAHAGRGVKNAVNSWYLSKDVMELAEIVTKHRSHYMFKHKDVFKLTHIKTDDVAKGAVIAYAMHGLDHVLEKYKEKKEVQNVLQYFQAVEELKHTKDINIGTRLLESNSLSLEHVSTHGELIVSKEIWMSLIPTLPPHKLLDHLQSLSIRGFFRNNTAIVRRYCEALNNPMAVVESAINPARVLIALRTYELRSKDKIDLAVKLNAEWAIKKSAVGCKVNNAIVEAMRKLFELSFKMLVPTGLRYLVAMDGRDKIWTSRCWHSRFVTVGEAATLMALNLIRTELAVTFGTFNGPHGDFVVVRPEKNESMANLITKTKSACVTEVFPSVVKTIHWAEAKKKMVDVFVVFGDNNLQVGNVATALSKYKRTMDLPNAKVITCGLNGPFKRSREAQGNGQLCVFGFDEHVPRVIEAFARGAF